MRKRIIIGVIGIASLAASFAMANEPHNLNRDVRAPGFYVGPDLGYSDTSNSALGLSSDVVKDLKSRGITEDHSGLAIGGHGGYGFNKYFALEGGYMRLARIGIKYDGTFLGARSINVAYADAKVSYPLANKFSVYGKVGYAAIMQKYTGELESLNYKADAKKHTDFDPMAGAGVEYRVSRHLGLDLQYTAYINPHSKNSSKGFPTTNMATVGLNIYF
jgi:OOP family OmpA-OmpF porin